MKFNQLCNIIGQRYMDSDDNAPVVLTVVNADGTVVAYDLDTISLINSNHPSGNGQPVINLMAYPRRDSEVHFDLR